MVASTVLVLRGYPEIDHFDLTEWVLYSKIVWLDVPVYHLCLCMHGLDGVEHLQEDTDNAKLLLAATLSP